MAKGKWHLPGGRLSTSTPHNNLFHYALSHAHAARDLIQTHLPADLVAALDLDSLVLQKDSFIDEELRDSYSDLLYSVQLAASIPMETLAMTIQKIFPTQIEPGSIADQYIKKGRQEGRKD
ncbi:MAG: Rpn family recombination-promoting nuclease/putative transposase [Pirellula sp.]